MFFTEQNTPIPCFSGPSIGITSLGEYHSQIYWAWESSGLDILTQLIWINWVGPKNLHFQQAFFFFFFKVCTLFGAHCPLFVSWWWLLHEFLFCGLLTFPEIEEAVSLGRAQSFPRLQSTLPYMGKLRSLNSISACSRECKKKSLRLHDSSKGDHHFSWGNRLPLEKEITNY